MLGAYRGGEGARGGEGVDKTCLEQVAFTLGFEGWGELQQDVLFGGKER